MKFNYLPPRKRKQQVIILFMVLGGLTLTVLSTLVGEQYHPSYSVGMFSVGTFLLFLALATMARLGL
jgi:lipopolysaccharide export LptBFGC system permease protein LptF